MRSRPAPTGPQPAQAGFAPLVAAISIASGASHGRRSEPRPLAPTPRCSDFNRQRRLPRTTVRTAPADPQPAPAGFAPLVAAISIASGASHGRRPEPRPLTPSPRRRASHPSLQRFQSPATPPTDDGPNGPHRAVAARQQHPQPAPHRRASHPSLQRLESPAARPAPRRPTPSPHRRASHPSLQRFQSPATPPTDDGPNRARWPPARAGGLRTPRCSDFNRQRRLPRTTV
jgi:hypothetical protein